MPSLVSFQRERDRKGEARDTSVKKWKLEMEDIYPIEAGEGKAKRWRLETEALGRQKLELENVQPH